MACRQPNALAAAWRGHHRQEVFEALLYIVIRTDDVHELLIVLTNRLHVLEVLFISLVEAFPVIDRLPGAAQISSLRDFLLAFERDHFYGLSPMVFEFKRGIHVAREPVDQPSRGNGNALSSSSSSSSSSFCLIVMTPGGSVDLVSEDRDDDAGGQQLAFEQVRTDLLVLLGRHQQQGAAHGLGSAEFSQVVAHRQVQVAMRGGRELVGGEAAERAFAAAR